MNNVARLQTRLSYEPLDYQLSVRITNLMATFGQDNVLGALRAYFRGDWMSLDMYYCIGYARYEMLYGVRFKSELGCAFKVQLLQILDYFGSNTVKTYLDDVYGSHTVNKATAIV